MIKVRTTSRLRFSRLLYIGVDASYPVTGVPTLVECWEMPEYPTIAEAPDDIIYTVNQDDRIDLIANKFYGAADLWWVIAIANDLNLLPSDLKPYKPIRVPSPARVFNNILPSNKKLKEGIK